MMHPPMNLLQITLKSAHSIARSIARRRCQWIPGVLVELVVVTYVYGGGDGERPPAEGVGLLSIAPFCGDVY